MKSKERSHKLAFPLIEYMLQFSICINSNEAKMNSSNSRKSAQNYSLKFLAGLWNWTGFGNYIDSNGKLQRGKTLWDWMSLLIVPALIAGGLAVFNQVARENELAAATDSARETALENYIDRMRELLITDKLGQAGTSNGVTTVAQTLTLTVVHRLDIERIGTVVTFLCRARLIQMMTSGGFDLSNSISPNLNLFACDLSSANLTNANLASSDLTLAILSSADLSGANISGAKLVNAELSNANLSGANLLGTDLSGASLFEAIVTDTQ
jgi:hypothetical protein